MKLTGKRALVTGGSSGLGLKVAELLVERKVEVHVCSRSADKMKQIPAGMKGHVCDISDSTQVSKLFAEIGDVEILVNCAGVWVEGALLGNSPEQIEECVDSNLTGVIVACREALMGMERIGEGFIVNVSSTSGLRAKEKESVYAASKWGLAGFTESLRLEYVDSKIKVAGFFPGGMNTGFFEAGGSEKENQKWMDPKEVAEIILFMLERSDSMVMNKVVVNRSK